MSIDPLNREHQKIAERLRGKQRLALLVLLAERLSIALWRPVAWVLFFCGLWLFQAPAILGTIISTLVLLVFIVGLAYLIYKDTLSFRWPSKHNINRRLEKDSNAQHRPLSGLDDALANPEKTDTRSLWVKNKEYLLTLLGNIRLSPPRAVMAQQDPYALRYGACILFILGMIIAGPLWKSRIWNGLTPVNIEYKQKLSSGITLWITPPDYTRQEQIVLRGDEGGTVKIPQGSTIKANVSGGFGRPKIQVGEQVWDMNHGGGDSYLLEMPMPTGTHLSIKQMMFERAGWDFEIVPDLQPVIVLKGEGEALPDGPLRFPLMLYDDYGATSLSVSMSLDEAVETPPPLGTDITETRAMLTPPKTEFDIAPIYDLTAHPWAGLPVIFNFEVKDHLGQSSTIPPLHMTLPQRSFSHPVARAIIDLRKDLLWAPEDEYVNMAIKLEDIMVRPDLFGHDPVVFLALRSASSRLYHNQLKPSLETGASVAALLWDTALRIEDGNLTLAARDLKDAQMALENALQDPNTTQEQIAQLMQELREAMAEYLMELHREMQQRMAENGQMPMISPEMMQNMMSPDMLSQLLDQMESQMLSGDRQSAQQMLSELQRMMDMMNPSAARPMPEDMQMMAEGVNELQQLIERQEDLLKQTKDQARILDTINNFNNNFGNPLPHNNQLLQEWGLNDVPPMPSQEEPLPEPEIAGVNTQENKTEQEALRFILGQLMLDAAEVLPEIPENMGLAEQEMRGSSDALGNNRPDNSIPHQEKALEHLKESQEQLSQQFAQRMLQMTGMMFGSGMQYDPLGRPYGNDNNGNNPFHGSEVKVPSDAERKRAREILDLLRRRAGEQDRPQVEREYYRRLLKQF